MAPGGEKWDSTRYRIFSQVAFSFIAPKERPAVEDKMKEMGHPTTWNAIRKHFQKINKEVPDSSADPTTPSKRSPSGPKQRPASTRQAAGRARASNKRMAETSDDDEDKKEVLKTPSKRMKKGGLSIPNSQTEDDYVPAPFFKTEFSSGESTVQQPSLLDSASASPIKQEENTELMPPTPEDEDNDPTEA
ncbi:hypothetical protein F5Y04DRAFT_148661 [Hypomontagnella monticulosa]|nr:hypothetical protein F5Y04DRAFT_148661 [Hypomontagnella monticulosa]